MQGWWFGKGFVILAVGAPIQFPIHLHGRVIAMMSRVVERFVAPRRLGCDREAARLQFFDQIIHGIHSRQKIQEDYKAFYKDVPNFRRRW
jgi:hypothetical protein